MNKYKFYVLPEKKTFSSLCELNCSILICGCYNYQVINENMLFFFEHFFHISILSLFRYAKKFIFLFFLLNFIIKNYI